MEKNENNYDRVFVNAAKYTALPFRLSPWTYGNATRPLINRARVTNPRNLNAKIYAVSSHE